jgi:hypothetical protein
MNRPMRAMLVAALLLARSTLALAQSDNYVRYGVTPYAWLAGVDGQVGVGSVATDVDLSFSDIFDHLKFAVMGYGEARVNQWVFGVDALYMAIGDGRAIAFRGETGNVDLTQRQTIVQPVAGISFGDGTWLLDVLAGFRYWNLDVRLDVDRPSGQLNRRSGSRQWVDATGGFRLNWAPYPVVRIVGAADLGGGGSQSTVNAYGSFGVNLYTHWLAALGYRFLSVDYDHDRFLYDVNTQGVTIGLTYKF